MCLAIPYQVKSIKDNKIILNLSGQKRTVKESLVDISPGDFVIVQQGVIIKKLPPKEAKKILKLTAAKNNVPSI